MVSVLANGYYDPAGAPLPYDVVWCRWPADDDPTGFKPRPALVRQVYQKDDRIKVEVAYGTSKVQIRDANSFGSFVVARFAALEPAGLDFNTRFELANTLRLPWSPVVFCKRLDGKGPVIGRLPDIEIGHLQERARILRVPGWQ